MCFANIVFLFKLIDVLFLFNKIRYLLTYEKSLHSERKEALLYSSIIIAFLIAQHFQRVACVGTYQRVERRLPYNLHQAKLNLVLVLQDYN